MKAEHWEGWIVGLLMGFALGIYVYWDGQQPHPERPAPSVSEWAWR